MLILAPLAIRGQTRSEAARSHLCHFGQQKAGHIILYHVILSVVANSTKQGVFSATQALCLTTAGVINPAPRQRPRKISTFSGN